MNRPRRRGDRNLETLRENGSDVLKTRHCESISCRLSFCRGSTRRGTDRTNVMGRTAFTFRNRQILRHRSIDRRPRPFRELKKHGWRHRSYTAAKHPHHLDHEFLPLTFDDAPVDGEIGHTIVIGGLDCTNGSDYLRDSEPRVGELVALRNWDVEWIGGSTPLARDNAAAMDGGLAGHVLFAQMFAKVDIELG